jgi:hypothetical protein
MPVCETILVRGGKVTAIVLVLTDALGVPKKSTDQLPFLARGWASAPPAEPPFVAMAARREECAANAPELSAAESERDWFEHLLEARERSGEAFADKVRPSPAQFTLAAFWLVCGDIFAVQRTYGEWQPERRYPPARFAALQHQAVGAFVEWKNRALGVPTGGRVQARP